MISHQIFAEIGSFAMLEPPFKVAQADSHAWLLAKHLQASPTEERSIAILLKKYAVKPSLIETRLFDMEDFTHQDWQRMQIFNENHEGADMGVRSKFFLEKSSMALNRLFEDESQPEHLIHVTCTGYVSPSAVQKLVIDKNWSPKTGITHAYHMGCYAALPASRIAEGLIAANLSRVDVVHTELCGLHMNAMANTPEQIVVQSLFADGYIKYSLLKAGSLKKGFSLLKISELLLPDSSEDMSWVPVSWGMQMTLSREVPGKIKNKIKNFLEILLKDSGCELGDVLKNAIFAIHPGGPKIISSLQEVLELGDEQVMACQKILKTRGNMSSATLPHVWRELEISQYQSGRLVVSLAFGPGLTIFGSLMRMI